MDLLLENRRFYLLWIHFFLQLIIIIGSHFDIIDGSSHILKPKILMSRTHPGNKTSQWVSVFECALIIDIFWDC